MPIGTIVVAFVKDGNLQVWEEATQQTRTILNTGDVLSVTTSEDGQVIAFSRRSWVGDVLDGYEQFASWAMNHDGGNPRTGLDIKTTTPWSMFQSAVYRNFAERSRQDSSPQSPT